MTILPYLAIALLLAVLTFRWIWLSYMTTVWHEVVGLYVIQTGARSAEVIRLVEQWPMHLIMLTFWRWHYRDFLINQTDVQFLLDFFAPSVKVETDE